MRQTPAEFARAKLVEELGELLQLIGKLQAFPDNIHPDGKGDLRYRLLDEIADIYAALRYFREQHRMVMQDEYMAATNMWERINAKLSKFRVYGETGT